MTSGDEQCLKYSFSPVLTWLSDMQAGMDTSVMVLAKRSAYCTTTSVDSGKWFQRVAHTGLNIFLRSNVSVSVYSVIAADYITDTFWGGLFRLPAWMETGLSNISCRLFVAGTANTLFTL